MKVRTSGLLLVLSLLIAAGASARVEFKLLRAGTPVAQGEVCFVRLADDTSRDPAEVFFASNDVRCLPANTILQFPVGRFHFYGRSGTGLVGTTRGTITVATEAGPRSYKAVAVDLEPAATLDFSRPAAKLREGEFLGVWIGDRSAALSSFLALPPGATSISVPAGVPVVPMLVARRQPVALGETMTLDSGKTRAVPELGTARATGDVVVWIHGDRALLQTLGSPQSKEQRIPTELVDRVKMTAPVVTLVDAKGVEHAPELPLFSPDAIGTLMVFRHIPAGAARVRLDGATWEHDELPITVRHDVAVQYLEEPLTVIPAGILTVRWWMTTGTADAAQALTRSCAEPAADASPALTIAVYRCAAAPDDAPIGAGCVKVATRTAPVTAEAFVAVESMPTGSYRVELSHPLGVFRRSAVVVPVHSSMVSFALEPFPLTGKVTRLGKPVKAQLRFATGTAATSESGEFHALLAGPPDRNLIDVQSCDGSLRYRYIPERPLRANERLDIEVPATSVSTHVIDAATGAPLPDAQVRLAVVQSKDDGAAYYSRITPTDAKGAALTDSIPPEYDVMVCAQKDGYAKRCLEQFVKLERDEQKQLSLALVSADRRAGVLRGVDLPIGLGKLFWVTPQGAVSDESEVREDGTFFCRRGHTAAERLVFASKSHPLALFAPPPSIAASADDAPLELAIPFAPRRGFEVRLPPGSGRRGARIGLTIGGFAIPTAAYVWHQMYHSGQPDILSGRSVRVTDVLETAPIAVAFGPEPDDPSYAAARDVFGVPALAASFPRVPVTGPVVELP